MKTDVPKDIAHMTELHESPPCPHCGAQDRRFCRMKFCELPFEVEFDKDEDVGS